MSSNNGNDQVYLDYAAATPMDQRVVKAMQPYFSEKFYNPSNVYLASRSVKQELDEARAGVAFWLGAKPSEIVFTAGATEANNLAIRGLLSRFKDANCVVSAIEHDSVLSPARDYGCKVAGVDEKGRVKVDEISKLIDDNTVLVSVIYANNEIGSIQPISEISRVIEKIRLKRKQAGNDRPIYLHCDGAQASQYLDLHVDKLGVDLLSLNGGKIYGPKQSGALFIRGGVELSPEITGGGQEFGIRAGTENVAGSVGFAKALSLVQKQRGDESKRVEKLRDVLISGIEELAPDVKLNGAKNHRLANNVSFSFDGLDGERLVMMLDEKGIICNTGAACSAQKDESSHVIKALGCSESEAAGTLRFTLGKNNTESDIEKCINRLKEVLLEYSRL